MPDETRQDMRRSFMSDEEVRMVDDYLAKIEQRRSDYSADYERWDLEQQAYSGDQPLDDNSPNTRVNIVNANIEGQVAALVEQNIAVVCRGEGPSDKGFADWARIGLDWTLRKNKIKRLLERHERRRELFGPAWFKLYFNPDAVKGFGLVTISCPPPASMYVDGKVSDPFDLQSADYIAEVMESSKSAAIEEFGDRAEAIHYGGGDPRMVFAKQHSSDDDDLYWLIQCWVMCKPKSGKKRILRLLKFSDDGVLLYDSFRKWNGKRYEELTSPKPFYRYNKYPYFLTNLYYEEGKLFGFGDGKLLRPLQDMINDLYDQARRAARPNRVFFDERSEVDLAALDEDDGPVPCNDPNATIRVVEMGRVNDAIWRLVDMIHSEVQRVIRFSDLMLSMSASGGQTATESNIQQQQGMSGIDHKKLMLQETLVDLCEYALDLMIEHYTEAKAFRLDEDEDDYTWIDFRQMDKIPVQVPTTSAFRKEWLERNPDVPVPEFEVLKDDDGSDMTKSVDLDIEVTIGAGLPKNKAFLYQMLERLAPLVAVDKAGMQKPVLTWEELRNFIEDFLGLPLEQPEETPPPPPVTPTPPAPGQTPMANPTAAGMTANGGVQMPVAAGGGMLG
jgi:hypothetical protein